MVEGGKRPFTFQVPQNILDGMEHRCHCMSVCNNIQIPLKHTTEFSPMSHTLCLLRNKTLSLSAVAQLVRCSPVQTAMAPAHLDGTDSPTYSVAGQACCWSGHGSLPSAYSALDSSYSRSIPVPLFQRESGSPAVAGTVLSGSSWFHRH